MRLQKKCVLVFVAIYFVANLAHAWVQFIAPVSSGIMWLGRIAAANVTMARAVEWSLLAHGALIGFLSWHNSDQTAQTSTPIKARIAIDPRTDAVRDNPDPNKFDNASGGSRDPAPKSQYAAGVGMQNMPATFADVAADMGYQDSVTKSYCSGSGCGGSGTPAERKEYGARVTGCQSSQYSSKAPGSPWSASTSWCGWISTINSYYAVWDYSAALSCPAGYNLSSGNCVLSDATKVMKPAGKLPCEVLRNSDGTWNIDAKNPECAAIQSQLTTTGSSVVYQRGSGDYDQVTSNPDGSLSISTRGQQGNRDIKTDYYSASQGGYPITGITDYGANAPSGTSGTGSGGMDCGTAGKPDCKVDVNDSAFQGKDADIAAKFDVALTALDQRKTQIEGVNDGSAFGIDTSWIPSLKPGSSVACQPLQWQPSISHGALSGTSTTVQVDYCDKLDVIREYLAWLFGVVTVIAVAHTFFSSNGNIGKGKT